ncbi:MAG: hypothetical protein ACK41U_03060 [Paracoccus sp. (in: a-proteobacteria)]|uniref:hypothetical protein n=1 Tax=Paracoccus sp. TaxID=267 RepID=UPI00391B6143
MTQTIALIGAGAMGGAIVTASAAEAAEDAQAVILPLNAPWIVRAVILAISYPDLAAVDTALASPARTRAKA